MTAHMMSMLSLTPPQAANHRMAYLGAAGVPRQVEFPTLPSLRSLIPEQGLARLFRRTALLLHP